MASPETMRLPKRDSHRLLHWRRRIQHEHEIDIQIPFCKIDRELLLYELKSTILLAGADLGVRVNHATTLEIRLLNLASYSNDSLISVYSLQGE